MTGRYALATLVFNGSELAAPETVEREGPRLSCGGSLPAPTRVDSKHDVGAGRAAGYVRLARRISQESPNGLRLSGDGGEADGVRCSRGFGESWLMSRNTRGRYAWAGMLFNGPNLRWPENVEPKGPGASAPGSRTVSAKTGPKHDIGASRIAGDRSPGPSNFSRDGG